MPKLESHLRSLSARSLSWVLTGRMTLDEARYLDAHPGLTDDQVEGCMRRRHGKHHERFVELAPGIDRPIEDLDALLIEAWDLPSELLEAFTAGSLTFIDARYAARRLSVRSRRQFIGIQISLIEDLECQQVLNEMERDPRVPRDLIAGYRVTPINARYLRLYFGAITGAPVPAPLA